MVAPSRRDFLFLWTRPGGRVPDENGSRSVAVIDPELCSAYGTSDCRLCETFCPKPGAIVWGSRPGPVVDPLLCDGCGRCLSACEAAGSPGAIQLEGSPARAAQSSEARI